MTPPPRLVPDRPSDAAIATVAKMIADTLGRPAAPNILELAAAIVAEVRHGQ